MNRSISNLAMVAFTALSVSLAGAADPGKPGDDPVRHVDGKEAVALVAEKRADAGEQEKKTDEKDASFVVLDVRTPEEFAAGHIEGARNIDFKADDFAKKAGKLDRKKTYLVHCRSGARSTASLEVLRKLGFENLIHLDGGFIEWNEAGGKVVKEEKEKSGKKEKK